MTTETIEQETIRLDTIDLPEEEVEKILQIQHDLAGYQTCILSSHERSEKEFWREEWVSARLKYDQTIYSLGKIYGAANIEYHELNNPYPPKINFATNKMILTLKEQPAF